MNLQTENLKQTSKNLKTLEIKVFTAEHLKRVEHSIVICLNLSLVDKKCHQI